MLKSILTPLLLLTLSQTYAQVYVGVFGGTSNYLGDLVDKPYDPKQTKAAIGLTATYEFSERLSFRGGLTYGKITGDDKYNKSISLLRRNLNFESNIVEFSAVGEINAFSLYNKNWTPYVFAGLAAYHYNPYTFDSMDSKVYLHPLSTEGQGLPGSGVKPYSLTQLSIPFGGGLKFQLGDNVRLGLEIGLRKLFNDYLDDVSTNYADRNELLAAKGQQAVDYAYRGDELGSASTPYPAKGTQRGSARQKDWYYFSGVHLSFRLPSGSNSTMRSGRKSGYGCPPVPY